MAISTAYPNYFVHNSTSILETSVKVKPHFLRPSEVKPPENLMAKLPKSVTGDFLYSGNGNLAKEVKYTYAKHKPVNEDLYSGNENLAKEVKYKYAKHSPVNEDFHSGNENLAKEVKYTYAKQKPEYSKQLEGMEVSKSSVYGSNIRSSALMNGEIGLLSPRCNLSTVSDSFKDASKNVKGKQRLSLGSIPKFVKCFSCERIVKEDHFCEHLMFGSVKCSDCNEQINCCQSLQIWATEFSLGVASCEHSLSYCEDPAEYLSEKLSGSMLDVNDIRNTTTYFENYINKLDSLKEQKPWKQAIAACRGYILNRKSSLSQSSTKSQQKRDLYFKNFTSRIRSPQDEQTGQNTCESSLLTKKSHKSAKKYTNSIKQKDTLQNDMHNSRTSKVALRNDLEFIDVPKNGFYYVSKEPVDECPNCYTFLSPHWATVNVNSFLITVICGGCNLTIYITSPKVKIITDTNMTILSVQECSKSEVKSKRRSLAPQIFIKK